MVESQPVDGLSSFVSKEGFRFHKRNQFWHLSPWKVHSILESILICLILCQERQEVRNPYFWKFASIAFEDFFLFRTVYEDPVTFSWRFFKYFLRSWVLWKICCSSNLIFPNSRFTSLSVKLIGLNAGNSMNTIMGASLPKDPDFELFTEIWKKVIHLTLQE